MAEKITHCACHDMTPLYVKGAFRADRWATQRRGKTGRPSAKPASPSRAKPNRS
jgi:hypothetical protein